MPKESKPWRPSLLEKRCLQHLDSEENWRLLNRSKPPPEEELPWKPFGYIFRINIFLFAVVFAILGVLGGVASASLNLEWIVGTVVFGGFAAAFMAFLSAFLYRRSWNRRARSYRDE